jgi:hypothetical protein|nr:MAG TPA: hypothetical protein [Caudoviricetes sp.]
MTYSVWYDVWLKGEEKKETNFLRKPTVWHTFENRDEVRRHVQNLANRALLDGRTITITIHPTEY